MMQHDSMSSVEDQDHAERPADANATADQPSSNETSPASTALIQSKPIINVHSIYRNDPAQHAALLNKITMRLLPFLALLYTMSFLDRSNLSNVHKSMLADIHLTENQYGSASSIFFIPYVILEVPSNMILERTDARVWLARIIFTWGLISTLMLAITGYGGLLVARLLLGVAEAGFFPGIIFYLTQWFTPAKRAQRLAWIFAAQPISGVLGGLLAYPILTQLHGVAGLAGWRWVFLLEGSPTVFLGIVTWYYLPANPLTASWLTLEEREFLVARMKGVTAHGSVEEDPTHSPEPPQRRLRSHSSSRSSSENTNETTPALEDSVAEGMEQRSHAVSVNDVLSAAESERLPVQRYPAGSFTPATLRARLEVAWSESKTECIKLYRTTFSNRIIYLCIVTNFLILMPVQAITFYLPSIVAEIGVGPLAGNLISAIPYTVAAVGMFFVSHYSDRTGERARPIIACNILGFVSLALTAATMSTSDPTPELIALQLLFLSLTAAGVWSCKPALMALFTTNLIGNIAVAIAAVTTVGNISGIVAPLVMSGLRSSSGNYASGCLFLMACLVCASWTVYALNREILRLLALKNARGGAAVEMESMRLQQDSTASSDEFSTSTHPALVATISPPTLPEDEQPFSPPDASPMLVDVMEIPEPSRNRSKLK